MLLTKKRGLYEAGRVVYIALTEISVNLSQMRRESEPGAMRELSASIAKYGILQPLSVRRNNGGFELVSGERRLRAAKLAGLHDAPCIVLDVGEEESAAIVLVENLQRRDLDFIEEARALERLRSKFDYTQEEVARLVGRSQPAVANKLRLLKLPDELLFAVRESGLGERHARALLRLNDDDLAARALSRMIAEDMNVSRAEEYVEELLRPPLPKATAPEPQLPPRTPTILVRDYRFYVNSIERGAETMRKSGITVEIARAETDGEVVMTVRVPKRVVM
ncbi:MAG: ParB/RepB/Spo0J family partition protein [Oscillospiraceae bacterium]|jgi:ParB family chromosome partitioning protein|nr:ParB/RepB/Spo0J family partition protein [Oscillospiraceae bacterium]